jgi:hypothetical protein
MDKQIFFLLMSMTVLICFILCAVTFNSNSNSVDDNSENFVQGGGAYESTPSSAFCQDSNGNLKFQDKVLGQTDGISLYYGKDQKTKKDTGFYVTKGGAVYYSSDLRLVFDRKTNFYGFCVSTPLYSPILSSNPIDIPASNAPSGVFPPCCIIDTTVNNFNIFVNGNEVAYTDDMLYYFFGAAVIQNSDGTIFACPRLGTSCMSQAQSSASTEDNTCATNFTNTPYWISIGNINVEYKTKIRSDQILVIKYKDFPTVTYSMKGNCAIPTVCETNDSNEINCYNNKINGDLFYQTDNTSGCAINGGFNNPMLCTNNIASPVGTWLSQSLRNPVCYVDASKTIRCATNEKSVAAPRKLPTELGGDGWSKPDDLKRTQVQIKLFIRTGFNIGIIISEKNMMYVCPSLYENNATWIEVGKINEKLLPKINLPLSNPPTKDTMISNWILVQKVGQVPFTCTFPVEVDSK